MSIKVFNRTDFDNSLNDLNGIKEALKVNIGKEYASKVNAIQKLLTDARDCICYEKTSVPEGYNADYEIRKFFKTLMAATENGTVDNFVIQNLREVADSPTWIFDLLTSYLLGYTSNNPITGYLEEKRKSIVEWFKEIETFGYKSETQRKKNTKKKHSKNRS